MNGHTYDPPIDQRLENLAQQLPTLTILKAIGEAKGDKHELERILTGLAVAACNPTGATLAAMESRLQAISAALNSDGLTKEEADSLFEEMAELTNRINSAQDDAADDFADMRREARFGKGL